jgi:tRNA (guanine-N7-)-methyltransferase
MPLRLMIPPPETLEPGPPPRSAEYLRRVDDRLDTLRHLLGEVCPPTKPVLLEVGCGHGHFLTAYAAAHPQTLCLGIDIVRDRIARAMRKRNRSQLLNLLFLVAEAHEFIASLPPGTLFSAIYVLFPDPWPKRRHHKNRLMQSRFLDEIHARAMDQTQLHFRTDHEPYFAATKALIEAHPKWEIINEPWPFELETVFQARAAGYQSLIARPKFSHKAGEKISREG